MNTRVSCALARSAALAIALLLGGCNVYSSPRLEVIGVTPAERTPDGVSMVFTVDARNDNDEPLPLRDVEYTLDLDGERVFAGTRSAEATLRRNGTQQVRLPAVVRLDDHPNLAGVAAGGRARYRLSGTLRYVTPGQIAEILFDSGVRVPSVDFTSDGELDLSGAKDVKPGVVIPLPDTAPPPEAPQ